MHSVSQPVVPTNAVHSRFFDVKGWLVMAFMIALGITIRTARLLPESFIAVFYTGLSLALMATGGRFILLYWKRK